jgi:hypothetical protein
VLKDYSVAGYDALLLVRPSLLVDQRMECSYIMGTGFASQLYDLTDFISGIAGGTVIGAGLFPNASIASDFLTILVYDGSTYYDRISGFAYLVTPGYPLTWTADSAAPAIPGFSHPGLLFPQPGKRPAFPERLERIAVRQLPLVRCLHARLSAVQQPHRSASDHR